MSFIHQLKCINPSYQNYRNFDILIILVSHR